ncbi:F0F1 ATP synthase subunit delta [Ruicaihuangia caeni]|uniref:ATP synthase subunit delta n=1 Tax=Ruicaihuangia caeni TaxID=3042517 RepID=A0AAW6T0X8_9MICO|nr:F0F1 ATP synthase subunit delta [Klugiella sp. YN-L-19]MDI2097476.1 F0F1 ATP synthase subunit delta [Klugiella sp. YN-L-19]
MGSATREALARAKAALSAQQGQVDLTTGEQLFAAGRAIGDSAQLRAALADPAAEPAAKQAVVAKVFSGFTPAARAVLDSVAANSWSSSDDLLAGIEELGIRATAESAPAGTDLVSQIFAFGSAVTSSAELELAVGSKRGEPTAKAELVRRLLGGKASAQAVEILSSLVQQPRGRRISALVRFATDVVADQSDAIVADVTVAQPLGSAQLERLANRLTGQYGRTIRINQIVDPAVLGGIRLQIGDDVIDGSIAAKLHDLRLQLAG